MYGPVNLINLGSAYLQMLKYDIDKIYNHFFPSFPVLDYFSSQRECLLGSGNIIINCVAQIFFHYVQKCPN